MKTKRADSGLVEVEWQVVVAAEEALNASVLRTLFLPSSGGRIVSCGRTDAVHRAVMEVVPDDRQIDGIEKNLVEAAEQLRRARRIQAYVLPIGDDYIVACGESRQVAEILGSDRAHAFLRPAVSAIRHDRPEQLRSM